MDYGWAGTILRIDLNSGKISKEKLSEDFAINYIGGRGFNSKILYDETGPETDPLGPDNKLIFGVGPVLAVLSETATVVANWVQISNMPGMMPSS